MNPRLYPRAAGADCRNLMHRDSFIPIRLVMLDMQADRERKSDTSSGISLYDMG